MSKLVGNIKGFTLLEMLIVLVIMTLLLTLVPPLLSQALPSVTIKAVANDLLQDLNYVRNIAILKGKKSQVIFSLREKYYFSEDKDQGKQNDIPDGIEVKTSDVALHEVDTDNPVIAFFADGSSSGGVITLKNNSSAYSVVVDWITGTTSLEQGQFDE